MLQDIRNLAAIGKEVLESKIDAPKNFQNASSIIISGMGGSGISADIIKDWLENKSKIPVVVSKKFQLPKFANTSTLFISVSYSGNTWETLAQLKQAISRRCKIFGVTSNGKMEFIFKAKKIPYAKVPTGLLPRMALPYFLFNIVNLLQKMKLVGEKVDFNDLKAYRASLEKNARVLAKQLKGKIPIICTEYQSVGFRFKSELNENSKTIAKVEILPEMDHNEIESWHELNKEFFVIFLRDKYENPMIKKNINAVKKLAEKNADYYELFAKGKTKLERILYLIWFGDFVSYFLAKEKKINPERTPNIEFLKKNV